MLTKNTSVSFVATCNAAAAKAFYQEKLGLKLIADEYFSLVFNLNGHTLRIAKVDELVPAAHAVLGWNSNNIEETIKDLIANGVVFKAYENMQQDKFGIWVSPSGAKVAWFNDPDGNLLSITQLASQNIKE